MDQEIIIPKKKKWYKQKKFYRKNQGKTQKQIE